MSSCSLRVLFGVFSSVCGKSFALPRGCLWAVDFGHFGESCLAVSSGEKNLQLLTCMGIPALQMLGEIVKKSLKLIHINVSPSLLFLIFLRGNRTPSDKVPLFQLHKQTALNLVLLIDGCCNSCWI